MAQSFKSHRHHHPIHDGENSVDDDAIQMMIAIEMMIATQMMIAIEIMIATQMMIATHIVIKTEIMIAGICRELSFPRS
jgi:hypothetical protein